ncbi:SDR family NAD(P)-dependent oxidoreductase [Rhodococcus opacus]|uniref:SDR family NAD(P)-dependent oxidoreductase n=1 Tax=Rhodococcus opacus TaxID=37919 RepID=UPI001C4959FD|nr:glucose 1-dehydrogenase [Rhodococcus opacus]MBV6756385.1 glucose 1-dehydrogenase [Rhodococcus opacus]
MSDPHLAGKAALVTGGGGGFGRAICRRLAAAGADIAVLDRDPVGGEATAAAVREAGGVATFHKIDLTDPCAVREVVDSVVGEHGRLDIAVNNAGIGGEMVPLAEYPLDAWKQVIDVNLSSVFYCLQAELAAMASPASGGGSIINIASIMSTVAMPNISAYVASKHAVLGLTKAAAVEYGAHGVRVNAVGPSFARVGFTADKISDDAQWDSMAAQHPLGRTATPDDIADAVAHLASDSSSYVTGQLLLVDGGYTAQ